MRQVIASIHRALLGTIICLTTLFLAVMVSRIMQQTNGNIIRGMDQAELLQILWLTANWIMICVPRFRFDAIIKPHEPSHLFAQLLFGANLGVCFIVNGLHVFHAPLLMALTPGYLAPLLALACVAICGLWMLSGILRAICPPILDSAHARYENILPHVHATSRSIAALCSFLVGGAILVSVALFGRPTTQTTLICVSILLACALLLRWPRLTAFVRPNKAWHAIPHISICIAGLGSFATITLAFLNHTGIFITVARTDAIYPAVENMLMLPFMLYGLSGVALAQRRTHDPHSKPSAAEVFS